MSRSALAAVVTLAPIALICAAATSADARVDFDRAVALSDTVWDVGSATVRIDRGVAAPVVDGGAAALEVVFVGRATVTADPPDRIEADYLERFTGARALEMDVDRAWVSAGDPALVERLLRGAPAPLDEEVRLALSSAHAEWTESTERRVLGIDLALWRAALPDPALTSFVVLGFREPGLGRAYAAFDPEALEPLRIGRFVPLSLGDQDAERARAVILRERREGRYRDLEVADLGTWDTWVQSARTSEPARLAYGSTGFEVEHYLMDVRVLSDSERIVGRSTARLVWSETGRKSARFEIFPDLRVKAARDGAGRPLPFKQERGVVAVVLPEPSAAGGRCDVTIDYEGAALVRDDYGFWWLRSTGGWYPTGGDVSRATFDVTFRWPKKLDLVAAGRRVDGGVERDEAWERRTLDVPGVRFSFELGRFDVVRERVDDVEVVVAFGKSPDSVSRDVKDSTVETVAEALRSFASVFGDYPYPTLTIVTVPSRSSQGYPSFISLSHALFMGRTPRYRGQTIETVAHEIAHQWWGNKVGWWSYRDQWMSEALATYAAVWWTYHRLNQDESYLVNRAGAWRASLRDATEAGVPVAELGPLVLGPRLDSSLDDRAYEAIVYGKGALVFNTLVAELGESAFLAMLRNIADAVNHRVVETSTFFKAIERMSGRDLGPFVATFVEGTARPVIDVTVDVRELEDGRVALVGRADISTTPSLGIAVSRDGVGVWDAKTIPGEPVPLEIDHLTVPWRAIDSSDDDPRQWTEGFVSLPVPGGAFEIVLDHAPEEFQIDPRGLTFADRYIDSGTEAKGALVARGMRSFLRGVVDDAERDFRTALALPRPDDRYEAERARLLEASARLGLARVALSRDQDAAAKAEVSEAEKLLTGWLGRRLRDEREAIKARLEVRSGRFEDAYDRLSKRLYLPFRQKWGESLGEMWRRKKYSSGRMGNAEAYALLALAATKTGRAEIAEAAAAEAEKRGADLSALRAETLDELTTSGSGGPAR